MTKADIRDDLEKLRTVVNASNLSEAKKAGLHSRIDAVEAELQQTRSRLAQFWLLTGALSLGSQMVSTVADAPDAFTNASRAMSSIMAKVSVEKRAEEAETERHAPVVPLLTKSADVGDAEPKLLSDQSQGTQ